MRTWVDFIVAAGSSLGFHSAFLISLLAFISDDEDDAWYEFLHKDSDDSDAMFVTRQHMNSFEHMEIPDNAEVANLGMISEMTRAWVMKCLCCLCPNTLNPSVIATTMEVEALKPNLSKTNTLSGKGESSLRPSVLSDDEDDAWYEFLHNDSDDSDSMFVTRQQIVIMALPCKRATNQSTSKLGKLERSEVN
ncbi:hypothetical protein L1987_48074 [Smallanthus sonchifolius]|uniref:Uncharacterized protein n=1 Tax=Smallanthus sonchifolius TaxID=185202 RepID=A0ACB9FQB7_9ASTR|nr:hypothetical protein L1987_48074 [Smallanthus sonchifolius]